MTIISSHDYGNAEQSDCNEVFLIYFALLYTSALLCFLVSLSTNYRNKYRKKQYPHLDIEASEQHHNSTKNERGKTRQL